MWYNPNHVSSLSIEIIKYNNAILNFQNLVKANACLDKLEK